MAQAKLYWWVTFLLGTIVLALSGVGLASLAPDALLRICAAAALASLARLFPVRMPGTATSVSGAEIFVFLLLLLDGPAAAAIAAACAAAVESFRTPQRWTSRLGRPAMAALAMYGCGSLFSLTMDALGGLRAVGVGTMLGTLLLTAFSYFATGTLLMASLISLERREPVQPLAILCEHDWLALAFACSATIAGLVYLSHEAFGASALLAAIPMIAMFLAMIDLLFRKAEADERVQRERIAAAEREVAETARHMAALRASEERFDSAFTHATVGMVLLSHDGRILQANEALCQQLGRNEDDLVGSDLVLVVHADDIGVLQAEIGRLLDRAAATFSTELRFLHGSGHVIWMISNGALFGAEYAGEHCMIIQMQDVTARKHAETRLQPIAYRDRLICRPKPSHLLCKLSRPAHFARRHLTKRCATPISRYKGPVRKARPAAHCSTPRRLSKCRRGHASKASCDERSTPIA